MDSETIQESLEGLDTSEAALAAARPKADRLRLLAAEDPAAFKQKLGAFLLRRGFSYAVAREVTKQLLDEMRDD